MRPDRPIPSSDSRPPTRPSAPRRPRPRPKARRGARLPAPERGGRRRSGATRLIALELSAGLHLAVFLALWLLPHAAPAPHAAAPKPAPIEIALVPISVPTLQKAAPPAPARHAKPAPAPKAPNRPRQATRRVQAAAPKRLPPKPARVAARHKVPHQAIKRVKTLTAADLQARLDRRNSGVQQDEQQLAKLNGRVRHGAEAGARHGSGLPHGNPRVSSSNPSGSLAARGLIYKPEPVYPPGAEARHEVGTVVLRLTVTPSGRVSSVDFVAQSGYFDLDRAAARAAKQYRFNAADASVGDDRTNVTIHFRI